MEFRESRTCQNLMNAFAGESQARNRYTFYASVAKKEGLLHVEAIFLENSCLKQYPIGLVLGLNKNSRISVLAIFALKVMSRVSSRRQN